MPRRWLSLSKNKHNSDKMNLNLNGMVSMWKMRELVDKATNIVMNYTETEAKVIRALKKKKYFMILSLP